MCLIVFAWQVVPGIPLVLAGNRDEFFTRKTAPADWWKDHPQIYAGRDLEKGGTWLGITRDGRFAGLTNIRTPAVQKKDAPSRGLLVANYLNCTIEPENYIEKISDQASVYNGFNLIVGTREKLIWYNNWQTHDPRNGRILSPGIYGLSNDLLDSPWSKVVRTKAQFASLLCQGAPQDAYFEMLTDTTRASDCRLPKTGVSLEWERLLSAVCIDSPTYGTRVSTVVKVYLDHAPILLEHLVHQDTYLDAM